MHRAARAETGPMKKPVSERELQRIIEKAARRALSDAMDDLHSRAVSLAPIDTGDLRSSARSGVKDEQDGFYGWVNFDSPYALVQHEGHFQHPRGGQRKYLEAPFRANAQRYGKSIAREIRKAVGR